MKNFLIITTFLVIVYAFSTSTSNASDINNMIAASGYVNSQSGYSNTGKGYPSNESSYSDTNKSYNNSNYECGSPQTGNSSNSGYNLPLQNSSQADVDKAHQDALKWIQEHPQEAQQLQQMIQTLKNQQK